MSQVLIFVVLIFLLCHSLKLGLNLYELSLALQGIFLEIIKSIQTTEGLPSGKEIKEELDRSDCFRILSIFSNILIVFNSSINFFIYIFKDPKSVLSPIVQKFPLSLLIFYHAGSIKLS